MAEVYGLYSGRDGKIRYVGETASDRAVRFEEHKRHDWTRRESRLNDWLHSEWSHGYPVECALLQDCRQFSDAVRRQCERRWMGYYPNLLNERISVFTRLRAACAGTPPVIHEIEAYLNAHTFNYDGHVGLVYSRGWDRFRVFIYTGYVGTWLTGDAAPGEPESEEVWFSDSTRALNARNAWRTRQLERAPHIFPNWPPDRTRKN
jgi:hypothetical protein